MQKSEQRQMQIVTVKSSRHRQFDLPESRKQKVSVQLVLKRQKQFVQRQQQRPKV